MNGQGFRDALQNRKFIVGCNVNIMAPQIIEMLGYYGVDYAVIDAESSSVSLETIDHLILACNSSDIVPLVKVPNDDPILIRQVLDIGADGIVASFVDSEAKAESYYTAMRYPPEGTRGSCSLTRQMDYSFKGSGDGAEEQYQTANRSQSLIGIIENEAGVRNIEEILETGYLDAVNMGPGDLSQSMGYMGEMQHPEVVDALNRVVETADDYGVSVGAYSLTPEDAQNWKERGADYVYYSDVRLFRYGIENNIISEF